MEGGAQRLASYDTITSESQFVLVWFAMSVTCLVYACLTAQGLRNFIKYIVKQRGVYRGFYVFAILAAAGRLGRYVAMIVNMLLGNPITSTLSLMTDQVVSALLVAVGLCLSIIMLNLYTYI